MEELLASDAPLPTFFLRATRSPQVTAIFLVILLVIQFGSLCNSILTVGHFTFALARDKCLPFSKQLTILSGKEKTPRIAMMVMFLISLIVILPVRAFLIDDWKQN